MARAELSARPPLVNQIARAFSAWRYEPQRRDARFDLLRGFAVFVMIADHIGGDSWLFAITGGNQFFISAAEGFVFIAGLVMGIVYAPIAARQGLRAVVRKSSKRALTLYAQMILVTFVFAALSYHEEMGWVPTLTAAEAPGWVWSILTLHRAYFLTDVLLLYTFLIAAAGPLLVLLRRGFTAYVLVGSWALWALWQIAPDHAHVPWPIEQNSMFNVAAWQVLFVSGLAIGFHRKAIERRLARVPHGLVFLVTGLAVASIIALYTTHLTPFEGTAYYDALKDQLTGKADVRLGRLLVFAIFATFFFTGVTLLWRPIQRGLGWLLMPLGRHSMFAYGSHLFLIVAVVDGRYYLADHVTDSPQQNTLIQLACILVVWALVHARLRGPALATAALRQLGAVAPRDLVTASLRPLGTFPKVEPPTLVRTGVLVGIACAALLVAGDHAAAGSPPDSIRSAAAVASTFVSEPLDVTEPANDVEAPSVALPTASEVSTEAIPLHYPVRLHRRHPDAPVTGI